jgi:hypothetical protein
MALNTVVNDILWNLDTIGSINNHQTLLVTGDRLNFDTRYMQFIRRPFTGDSRDQILNTVEKTFKLFEEVLHSYQCNHYLNPQAKHIHQEQVEIADNIVNNIYALKERKDAVIQGLTTLSTFERYNDDSGFKIKMKGFMERIVKLYAKCESIQQRITSRLPNACGPNTQSSCCYQVPQTSSSLSSNHYSTSFPQSSPDSVPIHSASSVYTDDLHLTPPSPPIHQPETILHILKSTNPKT